MLKGSFILLILVVLAGCGLKNSVSEATFNNEIKKIHKIAYDKCTDKGDLIYRITRQRRDSLTGRYYGEIDYQCESEIDPSQCDYNFLNYNTCDDFPTKLGEEYIASLNTLNNSEICDQIFINWQNINEYNLRTKYWLSTQSLSNRVIDFKHCEKMWECRKIGYESGTEGMKSCLLEMTVN